MLNSRIAPERGQGALEANTLLEAVRSAPNREKRLGVPGPVLDSPPLAMPLAVLSGPATFLYYTRFPSMYDNNWAWVAWYGACLLVWTLPVFFALRAKSADSRIALAAFAFMLWLLSGVLAVAMMTRWS